MERQLQQLQHQLNTLKAECYDSNKVNQQLNQLLSKITEALGLSKENNITEQTLIERVEYLVSLEEDLENSDTAS